MNINDFLQEQRTALLECEQDILDMKEQQTIEEIQKMLDEEKEDIDKMVESYGSVNFNTNLIHLEKEKNLDYNKEIEDLKELILMSKELDERHNLKIFYHLSKQTVKILILILQEVNLEASEKIKKLLD